MSTANRLTPGQPDRPPDWNRGLVRGRPPSLGDARLFPNRRRANLRPDERLELQVERDDLFHHLDLLDRSMVSGAEERRELLLRLEELRDDLWPPIPWQRGRRPPATTHSPLPPTTAEAAEIGGVTLRRTCLAILARHGELPLVEIHAWLHRYGYVVAGHHPVKALGDALGHEHDASRAERTARGVYRLSGHFRLPDGWPSELSPEGDPSTVVDPISDPPLRHCTCAGGAPQDPKGAGRGAHSPSGAPHQDAHPRSA